MFKPATKCPEGLVTKSGRKQDVYGNPSTTYAVMFVTKRVIFGCLGALIFPLIHLSMFLRHLRESASEPTRENPTVTKKGQAVSLLSWLGLQGTLVTTWVWAPDTVVYIAQLATEETFWNKWIFQYSYPQCFQKIDIPIDDHQQNFAMSCMASHHVDQVRPSVIIVPGMFNTYGMSVFVSLATEIFYRWGANVIVPEMRGNGTTGRNYISIPPSLSVREGHDLLAVAKYARSNWKSDRVFLLGISLGGTYALSAAIEDGSRNMRPLLSGCCIVSAPMDVAGLIRSLSTPCSHGSNFNLWYTFYSWLLQLYCSHRKLSVSSTFQSYVDQIICPRYAVCPKTASPINRLDRLQKVPVLAIYAADDPVTTLQEADTLSSAVRFHQKASLVQVVVSKSGGHAGHFHAGGLETSRTVRKFFDSCQLEHDATPPYPSSVQPQKKHGKNS